MAALLVAAGPWGCRDRAAAPKPAPAGASASPDGEARAAVTIPAGDATIGCAMPVCGCVPGRDPVRSVAVAAFAIDRTEVRARDYQRCVDAGACPDARRTSPHCNAGRPERADHPINCLVYDQADAYCRWAGKRLPTEAEWVRAAGGGASGRFPWGAEPPSCDRAAAAAAGAECGAATAPVGARPAGASPYGVVDLGGNVWEMLARGPDADGPDRAKGGGFRSARPDELRVAWTLHARRGTRSNHFGVRCVADAP